MKCRRGLWATMVSCVSLAEAEAGTVPHPSNRRAGGAVQGQACLTPESGPLRSWWLPRWARVAEPTAALGIPADLVPRQPPTRSPDHEDPRESGHLLLHVQNYAFVELTRAVYTSNELMFVMCQGQKCSIT